MRKLIIVLIAVLVLSMTTNAMMPAKIDTLAEIVPEACYSDADLNMITNVVNGEIGGIGSGSVVLTYADGSQLYTTGYTLRQIHSRIVDNQVKSDLFPSTVSGCVAQCWSTGYTGTGWRTSSQWQSCREAVVDALAGGFNVPDNVFAATCDPCFC